MQLGNYLRKSTNILWFCKVGWSVEGGHDCSPLALTIIYSTFEILKQIRNDIPKDNNCFLCNKVFSILIVLINVYTISIFFKYYFMMRILKSTKEEQ